MEDGKWKMESGKLIFDSFFEGITRFLTSPGRYVSGLAIRSASIPVTSLSSATSIESGSSVATHFTALMRVPG